MEDDTCELTDEAVSKLGGPNRWSKTRIVLNHFQGCPFSCVLFQKKDMKTSSFGSFNTTQKEEKKAR